MARSVLSEPQFKSEKAAFAYVENRLWPNGPVCPHCGATDEHIGKLEGKTTRMGLHKCYACSKPFTVRIGTIFESSHLALHLWLQVIHLMCASKKGISTRQIQRMLQCSMKTAWFLTHRIRAAMDDGALSGPLGGKGKTVEADETYFGKVSKPRMTDEKGKPFKGSRTGRGPANKNAVVALVERGGKVRSFHVETANRATVERIVSENVAKESRLHTDESHLYAKSRVPSMVAEHSTVQHSKDEYVRGDVHSNSVEGYFAVFKRGMVGVYQRCDEKHLHRYLAEFDFRFSNREKLGVNDVMRAEIALQGVKGKRLTYETTRSEPSVA